MTKPIGYFKENGKTKPIIPRTSKSSKMSRSTSSLDSTELLLPVESWNKLSRKEQVQLIQMEKDAEQLIKERAEKRWREAKRKTVAEMEEITPELREKLQVGTYDNVSKSVEINGQKYYVVTNTDAEYLKEPLGYSDLEYIGISSATSGAVLFAQGEDAQELLTRFKNDGYEKFIKETKSEGYWEEGITSREMYYADKKIGNL